MSLSPERGYYRFGCRKGTVGCCYFFEVQWSHGGSSNIELMMIHSCANTHLMNAAAVANIVPAFATAITRPDILLYCTVMVAIDCMCICTVIILRLRIPILVRRGHVGLVHLQVPWKSFGSGTLRFELRDVYIALEPIGSCL